MGAILSPRGAYRYLLKRQAESMAPMKSTALFIMLNPSTADATLDDPTVRRCRGFAKLWDYNGLAVASLYALRSTNPAALWAHHDPVRPDNDDYLWIVLRECGDVVCAWGSNAKPQRAPRVASSRSFSLQNQSRDGAVISSPVVRRSKIHCASALTSS
ncbi:hypothetical protein PPGU19_082730 (plasmid) [Paraburkholderia sp. PGU19]|uniref:DUF1643 domain-containing protein n=1 Tax=Paraburkholderia sp. PGU19 TaxID=2735434 RepID=UPI0015DB5044|nr:DUF1643 domain-containing protein [Paraburkholderia sp. PGU19]BCG03705.1 hypothetical protein PPGU19_082730 [Paraburkholderia sp. PGU19]